MFEQKSLDKIDGNYFNIIIADSRGLLQYRAGIPGITGTCIVPDILQRKLWSYSISIVLRTDIISTGTQGI